ncbi:hypothetical protein F5148DRAFT_573080 [Russula earlei]|uniref:Uncharacterized protein n=1 Tax=Russula earlei TaxID=71964 RepID=A0ACC0UFL8_9AGAM|nr:hypothetical protein F5148DRAFT_573080 [Russula earlei]
MQIPPLTTPPESSIIVTRGRGHLSSLDTSRTASHPVTRLPFELLSEIMCYMPLFYDRDAPSIHPLDSNLDPFRQFTRNGPIRTPHWVAVSYVCRRWREIALRCKALWTCIPLVSVRWAERALALSYPHPLVLRINSGDLSLDRGYVSVDALCLAFAHMSRIRKIRMHSPWGTKYGDRIMGLVYAALCRGAPALEEFDLASNPPLLVHSGPDKDTMTSALAELRVLRLDQCYLPPDCFLFHPGLTHLRLSGTGAMWPALGSMLCTLALLPNLRVIELYGVLPPGHLSSDDPHSFDLPSLKEVHLGGTGQRVLAALRSLNLSENVQVFVTLPNARSEYGSPSRWLMKLRGKFGASTEHAHGVH